jgi:hypothetical protein
MDTIKRLHGKFIALMLFFASASTAYGHGDWAPKHSGVMNDGGELSFELVAGKRTWTAYVSDHGEPIDISGSSASLTIEKDGGSQVLAGTPRGGTIRFPAFSLGGVKKLSLRLTRADGSLAFGRFSREAVAKFSIN